MSSQPHHPTLAHRGRQESHPLQPLSRKDTTSTTATSSTSSSTWTSSSTAASNSTSIATKSLNKLRHPRPRSWHSDSLNERQKKEFENQVHKQIHQQNLYTDCGRYSNEWLFSGWGNLAKWALGRENDRAKEDRDRDREGEWEEERGRSERRND